MRQSVPKFMFLLMLLCAGAGLNAQTLKVTDPVKYNDYIVDQQNLIGEQLVKLIGMFDALPEDKTVVTDQLEILITQCKSSVKSVQNLKPIPNEFGMKQGALDLFSFYQVTMDTYYRQMIDEVYKEVPDAEVLQGIVTNVQENEAKYDDAFQASQGKFAKYHNIQLGENELQQELEGEE